MIRHQFDQVPSRGLLLGTCATLADRSNVATPIIRIAAIVVACLWLKLAVLLYCGGAIYYRLQR